MTPTRLTIELSVEQRPDVRREVTNEQEDRRLAFWIKSQPRLHRLVYEAARLAREAS